jgi:superfamily II helicase
MSRLEIAVRLAAGIMADHEVEYFEESKVRFVFGVAEALLAEELKRGPSVDVKQAVDLLRSVMLLHAQGEAFFPTQAGLALLASLRVFLAELAPPAVKTSGATNAR